MAGWLFEGVTGALLLVLPSVVSDCPELAREEMWHLNAQFAEVFGPLFCKTAVRALCCWRNNECGVVQGV